jgi:hypothetical protein
MQAKKSILLKTQRLPFYTNEQQTNLIPRDQQNTVREKDLKSIALGKSRL